MTDRMFDDQLDREIVRFLEWHAGDVSGAPTATEMALRLSGGVRTRPARRPVPGLAWILLAGLIAAAALGAVAIGSKLFPDQALPAVVPAPSGSVADVPPPEAATPEASGNVPAPEIGQGNGWIAYSTRAATSTTGVDGEIYLVKPGLEPRRIAGGDRQHALCPAFSPDGSRLGYLHGDDIVVVRVDAAGTVTDEARLPIDGGNGRRLEEGTCPVWSPSGDALAFLVTDGTENAIEILRVDGSRTGTAATNDEPVPFANPPLAWAPDGRRIAVALTTGIWVASIDGTPMERVSSTRAGSIAWSPDGTRLAYHNDGTGLVASVLTLGGGVQTLHNGVTPQWSPSGDALAFANGGGVGIIPEGGLERTVGRGSAYGFAGWSPDGAWLLQAFDASGFSWSLFATAASGTDDVEIVGDVDSGSARNFPTFGDISWQSAAP